MKFTVLKYVQCLSILTVVKANSYLCFECNSDEKLKDEVAQTFSLLEQYHNTADADKCITPDATTTVTKCKNGCGMYVKRETDCNYKFYDTVDTFENAVATCKQEGGRLGLNWAVKVLGIE